MKPAPITKSQSRNRPSGVPPGLRACGLDRILVGCELVSQRGATSAPPTPKQTRHSGVPTGLRACGLDQVLVGCELVSQRGATSAPPTPKQTRPSGVPPGLRACGLDRILVGCELVSQRGATSAPPTAELPCSSRRAGPWGRAADHVTFRRTDKRWPDSPTATPTATKALTGNLSPATQPFRLSVIQSFLSPVLLPC